MNGAVILRGRLPYRLEYSISFLANNKNEYANPYGVLYASPFNSRSTIMDMDLKRVAAQYKTRLILREYRFYYKYYNDVPVTIFKNLIY